MMSFDETLEDDLETRISEWGWLSKDNVSVIFIYLFIYCCGERKHKALFSSQCQSKYSDNFNKNWFNGWKVKKKTSLH